MYNKPMVLRQLCISIGTLLLLTSCGSMEVNSKKADIYTRLGYDYMENKKYPEALQNFLEAEKLNPNSSVINNGLAMTYYAREKYDLALKHVLRALDADPKNMDAQNNLGRIYIAMGNYDAAEKALNLALKDLTYSQIEKPLTNLGIVYARKNKPTQSKNYFIKALQANRNFCPAYLEYGSLLLKNKDYEMAGGLFDKAVKICENSPQEVHYLSALSYYQLGKKDFAIARLKEIIKLYPENEYADKSKSLLKALGQDLQ